ncbi:MAG: FAD-dependent oxidoreductase [Acidobacteria bacterium]|nr:FAD-dependent oxidoreductase [Acidobacteriota bacterium]
MKYDVIIIGGGPAGMSALIWCHSLNLHAVLLEQAPELGGQVLQMSQRVLDYPGMITENGRELRDRFVLQLEELGLEWQVGSPLEEINLKARRLKSQGQVLTGRAMIIATGARTRRLGIPGEDRFDTVGVSFSGTRDHSRYAGKKVCVIGGGDSAVENSLILSRVCPHVTLIHRSETFRARAEWLKQARENPKITIMPHTKALAIEGGDRVERLIVEDADSGKQKLIVTEGVFIKIGIAPNTEIFDGRLDLDDQGYIKVDRSQKTSIEMVYAAGDVCRPLSLSVATAAGHSATAAKAIKAGFDHLSNPAAIT